MDRLRILLAFLAGFLLIITVSCCASQREQPHEYREYIESPNKHPFLGGPELRVFDVYEISSVDEYYNLRNLYEMAEKCTGMTRDYRYVRVFTASKIMVKKTTGWSAAINGVWSINTGWVYVRRGRSVKDTTRSLVHEFAHYITQLHHDEIDPIIEICNVLVNETVPE